MAEKRVFKSKKTLTRVPTCYRGWGEWEEGDTLIGRYVKTTPNRLNKGKFDHVFEIEQVGFSDSKADRETSKEKFITLNCMGMLDKAMEEVQFGTLVEIEYSGKKEIEGGDWAGKEAHTCIVQELEDEDNPEKEEAPVKKKVSSNKPSREEEEEEEAPKKKSSRESAPVKKKVSSKRSSRDEDEEDEDDL